MDGSEKAGVEDLAAIAAATGRSIAFLATGREADDEDRRPRFGSLRLALTALVPFAFVSGGLLARVLA